MKRLFWMAAGAVLSTAGKRWAVRKAAAVVDQVAPAAVGKRVLSDAGRRLDAAKREGRAAMVDTEERLRARLR